MFDIFKKEKNNPKTKIPINPYDYYSEQEINQLEYELKKWCLEVSRSESNRHFIVYSFYLKGEDIELVLLTDIPGILIGYQGETIHFYEPKIREILARHQPRSISLLEMREVVMNPLNTILIEK